MIDYSNLKLNNSFIDISNNIPNAQILIVSDIKLNYLNIAEATNTSFNYSDLASTQEEILVSDNNQQVLINNSFLTDEFNRAIFFGNDLLFI